MLELKVKIRNDAGKKSKNLDLRKKGMVPAVLYGPKIKENLILEVNLKEFEKVYQEAGESSLVSLEADGKKFLVLIHAVQFDVISQKPIHVDFYQPKLEEEITVTIPLVFEGEAQAVKDLGGTLVRNIQSLEVKALPQNLPHEIKVQVQKLKTFEDAVLIKDLVLPEGVKTLRRENEIVALVKPAEKVEEELEKPVEEKVEEVEKVETKKEKEEVPEEAATEGKPKEKSSNA